METGKAHLILFPPVSRIQPHDCLSGLCVESKGERRQARVVCNTGMRLMKRGNMVGTSIPRQSRCCHAPHSCHKNFRQGSWVSRQAYSRTFPDRCSNVGKLAHQAALLAQPHNSQERTVIEIILSCSHNEGEAMLTSRRSICL